MQLAKVIGFLFLAAVPTRPVLAEDWKIIQVEGRAYVSFANVAQFYRFPQFSQVSRTVSLRDERRGIRAQAGTNEFYINGLRFFSDFPLVARENENLISVIDVAKIIEPVLRPNKIKGAKEIDTVVLDPGHGGDDSGTSGPWGNEKTFALDVALTAREELLRAGFKVEMTRSTDKAVALEERVAFANQFPRAVFISIHFNSARGGSGVESYALAPAGVPSNASTENHPSSAETEWLEGNAQDPANIALAAAVHAAILSRVSVFDRGVRHARFHVLREIKIPAVLVEAGFLNDRVEGAQIATPSHRQKLGQAMAVAVTSYNRAVNFQSSGPMLVAAASNLPPHTRAITDSLGGPSPASPMPSPPSAAIQNSN
ncbi:MAG: N-acetylmuramoyl-L-alanine amidase [Verrucomicrobiota bacterium]|nr:N-acetylmuramoyl-L-alanine amidase [Chthoniobacterales bacterium]MDQ3547061.1 N-acetylmuramoyl-L-alanine amidase [Verrucomicrobiota bacterium]